MTAPRTPADVERDLRTIAAYPVRRAQLSHECLVCGDEIHFGELYHDGGYGRRAHQVCVERALTTKGGAT